MPHKHLPHMSDFVPQLRDGIIEFPVHHVRGGTSTGLILYEPFLPYDPILREELLRHLMGVPLSGSILHNTQTTGLGRGHATSNKVFLADVEAEADGTPRIVSTLAQLASDHGEIDWSVNCGNMSSALPLWALDTGLVVTNDKGECNVVIRNTNTGVISNGRMMREADSGRFAVAEIPGVDGAWPLVDLFLHHPVGAKTGRLLPTGRVVDNILGISVSCVDVAVPMVIVPAMALGKAAHESVRELEADVELTQKLRELWVAAGLLMGLKKRDGQLMTSAELERSETIPKICIVGAPQSGGNIAVRYFTPQKAHTSMAVSGGCCLAAAAMIPGSVAHGVARRLPEVGARLQEFSVGIENPAGILDAKVVGRQSENGLVVESVAYRRSTQILLRGHVPLYRASQALQRAMEEAM